MKLTKAILASFCCLSLAGCATMSSRQIHSAPAAAPVASAGSELGAPPPPPVAPPSGTISVVPDRPKKMYNMEPAHTSAKKAPARIKKPAKTSEGLDTDAESVPVPAPKKQKPKQEPPGPSAKANDAPCDTAADVDPAIIASPVRKSSGGPARKAAAVKPALESAPEASPAGPSTYKSGATPQSAVRPKGRAPIARRVEPEDGLLPVSSKPASKEKLDTRLSS